MINLVKQPLTTIVVKRNDFSHNDLLKLTNRKLCLEDMKTFGPVNIKIVFVSPSGHTETIHTNAHLFDILCDGDRSCIIYG